MSYAYTLQQRLMSAFTHEKLAVGFEHKNWRRGKKRVKDADSFARYPGIAGCQTRMLAGHMCSSETVKCVCVYMFACMYIHVCMYAGSFDAWHCRVPDPHACRVHVLIWDSKIYVWICMYVCMYVYALCIYAESFVRYPGITGCQTRMHAGYTCSSETIIYVHILVVRRFAPAGVIDTHCHTGMYVCVCMRMYVYMYVYHSDRWYPGGKLLFG